MSAVMEQVETKGGIQVCELDDILPDMGVCALVDGRQVAIFRIGDTEEVYAIGNYDANSGAAVLSRGIVGDLGGRVVVASPIYKQHYDLRTGECLEDPVASVRVYSAYVKDGKVFVAAPPLTVKGKASQRPRLVVVGNGMAAMRVVEELLRISPELYDITVFGAEPHGNYNRILLSPVLSGEKQIEEIMLNTREWYARHGVVLHAGDPIVSIDRAARTIRAKSGYETTYDRMLLATGSNPVVIPVPGKDLKGVVTFRDLHDVDAMLEASRSGKYAVVIGGGLLGLEAANGLMRQGMNVTVVHLMDTLMERQLDRNAGAMLKASLEARGLKFMMQAQTEEIIGHEHVVGVRFKDDDEVIPADLVVMAVGIKPNVELAQSCGLRCERGVIVDDTLQTFDPRIYAVGECVQHRNATYGLVAPLWEQANVCATHLAQMGFARYQGSMTSTKLKVTGIDLFSAGDFIGGEGTEDLVMRDPKRGVYKRLVIKDSKVRGVVLFGDVDDGAWYFDLMQKGQDISKIRQKLLFGKAFCEPA
ncbi:MAG: nitrite reductase small subunit NirD [Rhizobium sp.]|nr:MAG: nitrite reductase small subunit NirD [Rhizobium sp.]